MTDTLVAVEPSDEHDDGIVEVPADRSVDERELVRQAREAGVRLTGPDGLLKAMTKTVLETALDEEMSEHLGYDKHDQRGRGSGNSRNGSRSKTVLTDACGQVEIDVPRDRAGTFEPQIVKKRQRRLTDVDEVVLSLYARGLTTGEISAHFADIYGAAVPKTRSAGSPTGCSKRWPPGMPVRSNASTPRCSSTRSMSKSAMGR